MIKHYLTIALRSIQRQKLYSGINITGLTIGIFSFIAISTYIWHEWSYDRFHQKGENIYRAVINANFDNQTMRWAAAPNQLVPTLQSEVPELDKVARLYHYNFGSIAFINIDQTKVTEQKLFFADSEIFDIFSFTFLKGNPQNALNGVGKAILNETTAKRYFGDIDPVGKTIVLDNQTELEITGVFKDFPSNSSLEINVLASFITDDFGKPENLSWGNASFESYMLVNPNSSVKAIESKIEEVLSKNIIKENRWFTITLQPLYDIHLYSGFLTADYERKVYGDINQIKILLALAFVVIVIASINYMNLTTAQTQRRNKEVGISKTLGASRWQVNSQFFIETGIFVFIAIVISFALFIALLPIINSITGKSIDFETINQPFTWILTFAFWIGLTFLSALYPAIYLGSYSPQATLKKTNTGSQQVMVRKSLVVLQFTVSVALIVCAIVFYKQIRFIQDKKLGYNPNQVIAIMTSAAQTKEQIQTLQTSFLQIPSVKTVARAQSYPGLGTSSRNLIRDGETNSSGLNIFTTRATKDVIDVLGIKLLAGNSLPETKNYTDSITQVVLNKTAVDYLNLTPEEAVGRRVNLTGLNKHVEVVGVTEDFHTASIHQPIGAYCFHNAFTESLTFTLVKVETQNMQQTLKQLESKFKEIIPSAFEYSFLDDYIANLYEADKRLMQVVILFTALAIVIACLGLYALAAYTAEQKIKEIGIRKVLGASVLQLVTMLSKDFMVLVALAFIIGTPLGYWIIQKWLEGFAYKTDFSVMVFISTAIVISIIAIVTVSFNALKAARQNPVKALKSE